MTDEPVMGLVVRNAIFTFVVPGTGAVLIPWWILERHPASPTAWPAVGLIVVGLAVYASCVRVFAVVGRGTPGPWDAPRRLVVVGPYRWVRNPIYIGALAVILGEAWLFGSGALLLYAGAAAIVCHVFVVTYEEPSLRRRFGDAYEQYRHTVPRWIPRRPRPHGRSGWARSWAPRG